MSTFPTDAEAEAIYDLAVNLGHISDDEWTISARAAEIDETVRDLVVAREAAAWDAGWSARADRPHLKRGEAVPPPTHINPYIRQEADNGRD